MDRNYQEIDVTDAELKGQIYTAVEKAGDVLRGAMGDAESKSVVVVPVVVVVSKCVINKDK